MNNIIVIPTLNPSEKIWVVVEELKNHHFKTIVIVNDGSDETKDYIFERLNQDFHCYILKHSQNFGKGAALKTAMSFIQEHIECVGIITLDDDGQHLIKDVVTCARTLDKYPNSLILGVRDFTCDDIPLKSKLGNRITSFIMDALFGIDLKDTQTGLRCIPKKYFDVFLASVGDRFEYETNMLLDSKKMNIPIIQVTIDTVYIDQNKETRFHPIKDSVNIYKQILSYAKDSIVAYGIDILTFILLTMLLPINHLLILIFASAVLSRLCSYIYSIICKKKSNGEMDFKYIGSKILISSMLTFILTCMIPSVLYIFKVCADLIVFVGDYYIKKHLNVKEKMHKMVKRGVAVAGAILFVLLFSLVSIITVVFKGPSDHAKYLLVNSCMESSALKFIPYLYFSDEEVYSMTHSENKSLIEYIESLSANDVEIVIPSENDENQNQDSILFEDVVGTTYHGKMIIVKDPSRLKLHTLDHFSNDSIGITVKEFSQRKDVELAFNAGGFEDAYGTGNGGMPIGVVISDGELKFNGQSYYTTFIGIDANDKLLVDNIDGETAMSKGARDGVSFGPVLVKNGQAQIQYASGGLNPRTAIGQREDGAILILLIDGRQANSLGATYNDLSNIMLEYGAINAGNLDGGSSSVLYQNGKIVNTLSSVIGEREVPTIFYISKEDQ